MDLRQGHVGRVRGRTHHALHATIVDRSDGGLRLQAAGDRLDPRRRNDHHLPATMTDRWMKLMMAGAALAGFFLAYQKYGKKAGHATHSFAKSPTSSLGNGCLTR